MTDILNSYLEAQQKLQQEKTQIESRLQQINSVLEGTAQPKARRGRPPKAAKSPAIESPAPKTGRKSRKRSAAVRAKMAAAQQARWAKLKGESKSEKPAAVEAPKAAEPKPQKSKKRKMSAEARARIAAAAKARWAKAKAEGKKKL